jgi:phosphatidylethanolamine-binding protein (PEBP) family uncharacterized protein
VASEEKPATTNAEAEAGGRMQEPAGVVGHGAQAGKRGRGIDLPKGPAESAPTAAQRAHAAIADIVLSSPVLALDASGEIPLPTTYTCDGRDSWPPLAWRGVPAGSAELVLFAMNVQPVEGKIFFDWAVAELDPGLEGIEADRLPPGAVVGENSFGKTGYSICPENGGETYVLALYAIPRRLSPGKGFDPRSLREEVLQSSGDVGLFAVTYLRG